MCGRVAYEGAVWPGAGNTERISAGPSSAALRDHRAGALSSLSPADKDV